MAGESWFSCKPEACCKEADPVSDTVRVDPALLAGKENQMPSMPTSPQKEAALRHDTQKEAEQRRKQEQEAERKEAERRQAEELAKRKREDEEAARRREQEAAARAAEERAAGERAEAEAAAAAAAKAQEEERLRLEAEQAAAAKAAADKTEQERAEAQAKVEDWCKKNGFANIDAKKKSFMSGSKFPLHEAVAKKNEEMVRLLVQVGADKSVKNSKGQTAAELAAKMNKEGSMDSIMALLS